MTISHRGEIGCLNHIVVCGLIQLRIMPFLDQTVMGMALCIDRTGHRDVIFDMPVDHVLGITGRAGHGAVEPGGVGVVLMVRYAEEPARADIQMGDLRHQNSNLKQADAEQGQHKNQTGGWRRRPLASVSGQGWSSGWGLCSGSIRGGMSGS